MSGYIEIPTTDALAGWTYKKEIDPNGHEYVDLGLSVKWATCNLGATKPEEYGNYYAWGEVTGYNEYPTKYPSDYTGYRNPNYNPFVLKTTFTWNNYKWGTGQDIYIISISTDPLSEENDAAVYNWNGTWRIPTEKEIKELVDKCYWTWTVRNGVSGYIVSGDNDSSIFLPAAGLFSDQLRNKGELGYYFSSQIYGSTNPELAAAIVFNSKNHAYSRYIQRYWGCSIRPVLDYK